MDFLLSKFTLSIVSINIKEMRLKTTLTSFINKNFKEFIEDRSSLSGHSHKRTALYRGRLDKTPFEL